MTERVADDGYRCPQDLAVTSLALRRMIIIGSCLVVGWRDIIQAAPEGCPCDFIPLNNAGTLPDRPPMSIADYDLQLIQIPVTAIISNASYFRLAYDDIAGYEALFREAKTRLSIFVEEALRWNREHGVLSFVCNFLIPQQNPMGRLLPRYDLRNFTYFFEKLNEALAAQLRQYENVHFFDFDQIVSTFGRRHMQDDGVWPISHGAALAEVDKAHDLNRLEPVHGIHAYYPSNTYGYILLAWQELRAMVRSIRQTDAVKLVIFDIDDTLWRGVMAEGAAPELGTTEGWPLGIAEAIGMLKRRGLLLAIVSKNDEAKIRGLWPRIFGNLMSIDDFAIHRINWRPKAENIEDILRVVNLLPRNVLFIDDNPVERAAVKAAFPDIRTFGPNPYLWRRLLLWSAETQVARISSESGARTEMVQAQVERETQRKRMSRTEFLQTLNLQVVLTPITDPRHEEFSRALELLNKTNQFNTTGLRWTFQDCAAAFARGAVFHTFTVRDRFTFYGTVGVVIAEGAEIKQFVMSCRVIGLDVEPAVLATIMRLQRARGAAELSALFMETDANLLCRDLYRNAGYRQVNGKWLWTDVEPPKPPAHVAIMAGAIVASAAG